MANKKAESAAPAKKTRQAPKKATGKAAAKTTSTKKSLVGERYAIIKTGGKQYQAIEGKTIAIEKLEGEPGASIEFTEVLLRKSDGEIEIGRPFLSAPVKASIVKQMQGPKVIIFKFRRRKGSRVKKGHRQPITVVRIESV